MTIKREILRVEVAEYAVCIYFHPRKETRSEALDRLITKLNKLPLPAIFYRKNSTIYQQLTSVVFSTTAAASNVLPNRV